MENVMNKPKISNFITKMINIKNALPITPASLVTHVDDTPYCWAFLAYDSILDDKIFAGTTKNVKRLQYNILLYYN